MGGDKANQSVTSISYYKYKTPRKEQGFDAIPNLELFSNARKSITYANAGVENLACLRNNEKPTSPSPTNNMALVSGSGTGEIWKFPE